MYSNKCNNKSETAVPDVPPNEKIRAARRKIKLADDVRPWTGQAGVRLQGVNKLCGRSLQNLDMCFWKLRRQHKGVPTSDLVDDAWCNISQSIDRLAVSKPCSLSACWVDFVFI